MIFKWNEWNLRHIAEHGVSADEVESVVRNAEPPYPAVADGEKWLVVGQAESGRLLHVIFVLQPIDDVAYEELTLEDLAQLEDRMVIHVHFVIHAMPASPKMKRHDKRRRKR